METINKPQIQYYSSLLKVLVYTLPFVLFYVVGTTVEALKHQDFPLRESDSFLAWLCSHNQDNVMLYLLLLATLLSWAIVLHVLEVVFKKYIKGHALLTDTNTF